MNLRPLKLALLAAPALLLAACGGGGDTEDRLDIADPNVRYINLIPTASGNLTLYRNDVAQADATNTAYGYASKYYDVSDGNATWAVKTASGGTTVGSIPLVASRGNRYTLLSIAGATEQSLVVVRDPYNKGLTSDKARVRGVNTAFTVGAVDMYLVAPGTSIASLNPTFSNVGYAQASPADGADSVEVNGGTYELTVTKTGEKTVQFKTTLALGNNTDWLLISAPSGIGAKVFVAKSDVSGPMAEPAATP